MAKQKKQHSRLYMDLQLLRWEYKLYVLLLFVALLLEVYALLTPPLQEAQIPIKLGAASLPFRLSLRNAIPFLFIPLVFLVLANLFLRRSLEHNNGTVRETIRAFERHPHTRNSKRFCIAYAILCNICSVVLTLLTYRKTKATVDLFGILLVGITTVFLLQSGKLLRKCKRQYRHAKSKARKNG